jgi:PAS domain S-box-containing protein
MPVILLTGKGDYQLDVKAMRAGAFDFLNKDQINPTLLERSIRYAVEHKRTHEELKTYIASLEKSTRELSESLEESSLLQEELRLQNEEVLTTREFMEVERQRYIDLFEYAPDGYVVTDGNGIIKEANSTAMQLLGTDRTYLIGKPMVLFVVSEDRNAFRKKLNRLKHLKSIKDWEIRLQRWRRISFHSEVSVTSVLPLSGEPPTLRWTIRDISERKRIEEEIRQHREHLEELVGKRTAELSRAKEDAEQKALELDAGLNSIADGVMIFSARKKLQRMNSMAAYLVKYGFEEEELTIEEQLESLRMKTIDGQNLPLHEIPIVRAFQGETVLSQQILMHPKNDSKPRCISLSAAPIRTANGRFLGVIATFTDITQQRELTEALREAHGDLEKRVQERTAELAGAMEALQKSEEQLRFLSSRLLTAQEEERKRIAGELHDSIGSSLSAIKFGLQNAFDRMKRGEGDPESIERLIALTQQTIDEARRMMVELRPSMLDDLGLLSTITWFCKQFQTIYTTIDVETRINIEESDIPENLKIVIFRIMQEALHNIAKYSRAEFVSLSLEKRDGTIELRIEDSGVGFDMDSVLYLDKQKRGLGLTSMKERAKLSGGDLAVQSYIGEGTVVEASWSVGERLSDKVRGSNQ